MMTHSREDALVYDHNVTWTFNDTDDIRTSEIRLRVVIHDDMRPELKARTCQCHVRNTRKFDYLKRIRSLIFFDDYEKISVYLIVQSTPSFRVSSWWRRFIHAKIISTWVVAVNTVWHLLKTLRRLVDNSTDIWLRSEEELWQLHEEEGKVVVYNAPFVFGSICRKSIRDGF